MNKCAEIIIDFDNGDRYIKNLCDIEEKINNMTIEELTEELKKYGVEFTKQDKK